MAYAELGGVRAEYDVVRSGVKGMVVHFSFIIRGARPGSDQFTIMGWFIHNNSGRPVPGVLADFSDARGNACIGEDFTVPYQDSQYDDFDIFMPYDALGIRSAGTHTLAMNMGIFANGTIVLRRERVLSFVYTIDEPLEAIPETSGPSRTYNEAPSQDGPDYFALFNIPRNASQETIRKTLLAEYNKYRNQVNNPDIERRQTAERMLALISQARRDLLK
ncbi:MAG: J domain-containing protein [Bacillota bacterium]|nr:J domain-containing protein [Bacillota bacterium]